MFALIDIVVNLTPSWLPAVVVFGSVITFFTASLANIFPGVGPLYKEAIKILSILAFAGAFFLAGALQYAHQVKIEIKKEVQYITKVETQQVVVTNTVVKYLKAKQQEIGNHYAQIEQKITTKDDASYPVPNSFVGVYNAAAESSVSGSAAGVDGSASAPSSAASGTSSVPISTVEKVTVDNFKQYYEVRAQLMALQDWVKEQKGLFDAMPKFLVEAPK